MEGVMSQRPIAVGLLLCENVIVEEGTRSVTPVNCFTRRTVEQFPCEPLSFVVLAFLTDGSGDISLEVTIERLDTLEEVYAATRPLHFASPLNEVRCTVRVKECSFPVEGHYQVTLYADREPLAQRRLLIRREGQT